MYRNNPPQHVSPPQPHDCFPWPGLSGASQPPHPPGMRRRSRLLHAGWVWVCGCSCCIWSRRGDPQSLQGFPRENPRVLLLRVADLAPVLSQGRAGVSPQWWHAPSPCPCSGRSSQAKVTHLSLSLCVACPSACKCQTHVLSSRVFVFF